MNEDWMLDDNFKVESASQFLNGLSNEEEEFLLKTSGMKPCSNCGEWVNPKNMQGTLCNLCARSPEHERIRGSCQCASENHESLDSLVKRLECVRHL